LARARVRPPLQSDHAKTVPAGDAWLHEPKLDGYRLQVIKEGRRIRLYRCRGNEWTARLPHLVCALAGIPCGSAVIDTGLVRSGAGGVPDFYRDAATRRGRAGELVVFAFDLLHRDGKDLRPLPLIERRRRLDRAAARQVEGATPPPGRGFRRRRGAPRGGRAVSPQGRCVEGESLTLPLGLGGGIGAR
jgi:bifunctional non-homologous end joining protein LigD